MTQPASALQMPPQQNKLEVFLHLNERAMQAQKPADLLFTIVNETIHLAPYRQAAFFNIKLNHQPKLIVASGLVSVADDSPYTVWINEFSKTFQLFKKAARISLNDAHATHQDQWQEWLPEHVLIIPLLDKNSLILGYAMYAREQEWSDAEIEQLEHLHSIYSYCLAALTQKKNVISSFSKLFNRKGALILAAAITALMLIPIRLSALAPAEVIALNAFSVAAPQDGVIHAFLVQPNSPVKKGDSLFTLDNTSISNRYEVASKALATARADALVAEQRAFDDTKSKSELAGVIGRVREKEAELASIEALKARVEIKAERDGIAIFADTNDWVGRPVQTGERVMQIANPQDAGLLMWLPVHDALNLEAGAPMKLFLHTQPLQPIAAKLQQTSYQATLSPDNIASYRLKGVFTDNRDLPRIGLRGTARISGEWSVLGYYLFRRPIATVREWTGL